MKTWMDLAQELIVVDSYSTDGTFELLQAELRHPRLSLLQCPPGLYQSWNQGISRVQSKYSYVSTIGDTITREGLEHLTATAEALGSDVVISPPKFFTPDGGAPVTIQRNLSRNASLGDSVATLFSTPSSAFTALSHDGRP